jgi:hypothetical protein
MAVSIAGAVVPQTASADPVTAVVLSYNAYLAGLSAAGLTYGSQTYSSTVSAGMTGREISAVGGMLLQNGAVTAQQYSGVGIFGIVQAVRAGMIAKGIWTSFQAAVAGAYAYGSYAWVALTHSWASYLAFQGVVSRTVSYPSVTSVSFPTSYQVSHGVGGLVLDVYGCPSDLIIGAWAAAVAAGNTHGSPYPMSFIGTQTYGDGTDQISMYVAGLGASLVVNVHTGSTGVAGAAANQSYTFVSHTGAWGNAQSDWLVAHASAGSAAANPAYEPDPAEYPGTVIPGPWPGSPGNPFVEPPPEAPHLVPIPLPTFNAPDSHVGTTAPVSPATPTTATPVPYVPPIGTITDPIPSTGVPLPGKQARDAAAALDAAVPDSLAWLKAPLVAILGWLADLFDWLQSVWSTICAWFASWVIPSDAGLASAWTQPWASLQTLASTRWPFAIGTVSTTLSGALFAPSAASNTLGALSWTWNIFGMNLHPDLTASFEMIQPYRWVGEAFAWLWLVTALIMGFRPKVVT